MGAGPASLEMRRRRCLAAALLWASACGRAGPPPGPGVSRPLAETRHHEISDLRYDLAFAIPESVAAPVTGRAVITFALAESARRVVLDFRAPPANVQEVRLDDQMVVSPAVTDGHLVLPVVPQPGGRRHTVTVTFTATDDALNRNPDYLYTLFVPDRASTTFPSFDQPDVKARYRLTLTIPRTWEAATNGSLVTRLPIAGERDSLVFAETAPISTYLASFAAGKFQVEEAVRDGRALVMYHRETDTAKVRRNRDPIFDLHAAALRWLEAYTGIPYPFEKVAFVAVPAFQFGGMEHPGAVWYRASSLFLDESATQNQQLGRASLIAHETAHMWFGDLVTMRWFNDVWMKEVFANFMAAKIVEPSFPAVDHTLRFYLAHLPVAYDVDRTLGANPIRQELDNLREAGSLYGAIIYQKAPVVMRQLEQMVGDSLMREGLRRYLQRFRFANADWPDLIGILDSLAPADLARWSQVWVDEPGRPTVAAAVEAGQLVLRQTDPRRGRSLRWPQTIGVTIGLGRGDRATALAVDLRDSIARIPLPAGTTPAFVLAGTDGVSYGRFPLDSTSRVALGELLPRLQPALTRAVAWQALVEEQLAGRLPPRQLLTLALQSVPVEPDDLLIQQRLGTVRTLFWRFLTDAERRAIAPELESVLWRELERTETSSRKGAYYETLVAVTSSPDGVARLTRIWRDHAPPRGLTLSDRQYTALAEALALRGGPESETILDLQATRITNPDQRARFQFVRPALSPRRAVRDSLFLAFRDVAARRHESWVLDAMAYLNHPVREETAVEYVLPALDLVEEIQRTGDIFFPLRWLEATLGGHRSIRAAETVVAFLDAHPGYPPRLRGKILQAADDLFRAARVVHGWDAGPALESSGSGNGW